MSDTPEHHPTIDAPAMPLPGPVELRLFNTLTGEVDVLAPATGEALRMYACGPTVYDYGHIGNFRTFLQVDVLRRFLQADRHRRCAT